MLKKPLGKTKEPLIILCLVASYLAYRALSFGFGIYTEEFRDANAYLMVMKGMLPYRDFVSWIYGPFSFCIYPIIFKAFGVSLVSLRLGYMFLSSLTIPLAYLLSRRLMPVSWAALASILSVSLIDIPYYTYNHILTTLSGLCALLFALRFMEKDKKGAVGLFLSGIFAGIAVLSKPITMGTGTFFCIFFLLAVVEYKGHDRLRVKLGHLCLWAAGALAVISIFAAYFALRGGIREFFFFITPFGLERMNGYYVSPKMFPPPLCRFWGLFREMIPHKVIFFPNDWKAILVNSYDRLILFSPLIFPLLVLLLSRSVTALRGLAIRREKFYVWVFFFFSVSISLQSLFYFLQMGRSFTAQVPLILATYFIYLANRPAIYVGRKAMRITVGILSVVFVLYLSSLHLVRYPYSRWKKYNVPLELKRAQGITVTLPEKRAYEHLYQLFKEELPVGAPIAVMGYFPQFSFLLERENIFADTEDFALKLRYLLATAPNDPGDRERLRQLQDELIGRLKKYKPRYILKPQDFPDCAGRTQVDGYIESNYLLKESVGPFEVDIYTLGRVDVYCLKEGL